MVEKRAMSPKGLPPEFLFNGGSLSPSFSRLEANFGMFRDHVRVVISTLSKTAAGIDDQPSFGFRGAMSELRMMGKDMLPVFW